MLIKVRRVLLKSLLHTTNALLLFVFQIPATDKLSNHERVFTQSHVNLQREKTPSKLRDIGKQSDDTPCHYRWICNYAVSVYFEIHRANETCFIRHAAGQVSKTDKS